MIFKNQLNLIKSLEAILNDTKHVMQCKQMRDNNILKKRMSELAALRERLAADGLFDDFSSSALSSQRGWGTNHVDRLHLYGAALLVTVLTVDGSHTVII